MAILLSVYNGGCFLPALLRSLREQTYSNITTIARDDGSTDGSAELLEREHSAGRVINIAASSNLGAARAFLYLTACVHADIYMLCDQDDIWLPGKVQAAVESLQRGGLNRPLLYHCDLALVDENLGPLHRSFHAHEGIVLPQAQRLEHMTVQNCVVGCTMAFTEALLRKSGLRDKQPEFCAMHDWWLALCANTMGEIIYDHQRWIYYRQHGANVSGASRRTLWQKMCLQLTLQGLARMNRYRFRVGQQAGAFMDYYSSVLDADQQQVFRAASALAKGVGAFGCLTCALQGIRLQNSYMNVALIYSSFASLLVSRARLNTV